MAALTVYFVRHGLTVTNVTGTLTGRLDAPLAPQGEEDLRKLRADYLYPAVEKVYSSPALRCLDTAAILYPGMEPVTVPHLWEYTFGEWEGELVADVRNRPVYQKWLDQAPDCYFPGGETLLEAAFRAQVGMTQIIRHAREVGYSTVAVVAHGEIMNLLFHAVMPPDTPESVMFCPNGLGLVATADTDTWFTRPELRFVKFFPEGAPRPGQEDSPYFKRSE